MVSLMFSLTGCQNSGKTTITLIEKGIIKQEYINIDVNNTLDLDIWIEKFHDNEDEVTCWILLRPKVRGISCIPDWMLEPQIQP